MVQEILEGIEGVLFLDNAYVEFSDSDYLPLMKKHENLILGRTFSKVYSLAGLRIGYAFTPRWLPPWYNRASTPFTVNSVSAAAAAAALMDSARAERYIAHVKRWRERFVTEVKYPVFPSDANFVMVDVTPLRSDEMVGISPEKAWLSARAGVFPALKTTISGSASEMAGRTSGSYRRSTRYDVRHHRNAGNREINGRGRACPAGSYRCPPY